MILVTRTVLGSALLSLAVGGAALANAVEPAPLGVDSPALEADAGAGSLAGAYLAARQAGFNKDLASAARYYGDALGRDPQNEELLDRSLLMSLASGDIPKAATLAPDVIEKNPADQLAIVTLAVTQLKAGDHAAALATADDLEALGGQLQQLIAGLLRGWTLAADGQAAQAVQSLDALEGPDWYDAFTTLHAGLIADNARLFTIAEDRLRLAHERDPGAVRVVDAYARLLARTGETERALEVIAALEERLGGNDQFTEDLRAEIASGTVEPQIRFPGAGLAEAFYGIGSAIGREGGDTFAVSLLQLALFLSPQADYPAMALGQVLETMRQHEAAIDIYRGIPATSPMRRNALVQEALNLNILERHDEAIAILQRLVTEDPADVGTATALGNVFRSRERFAEAAEVYTTSINAFGEAVPQPYWTLHYYRGIAWERTGQWTAAEKDFRRALELEPENPLVLNYLGYSYIDRGENLDEALEMVRRAVEQRPEDGYIVDSLGWAYYRLGRYEDAVRELERAVELRPADPVINDHLGDAYWKVGRKLEAMFQWAHARDNDPEPAELAKILAKLQNGLDEGDAEPARAASIEVAPEAGAAPAPSAQ